MEDFCPDLDSLMEKDGEAKRYFLSLPHALKQPVLGRTERIHSFEDLKGCVDGLLQEAPDDGPGRGGLS